MRASNELRAGLALVALAVAAPAWAVPADFAATADALLKSSYRADAPGVAAIVVEDGKVVYAGGRGLADVEATRPITPATVFRLGSITKQFTAAIILQLAEEGKLSLSDPLSKFLPDYPKPGAGATITQLLNHTSGIKSYTGIPGWMASDKPAAAYTTDELIAEFRDQPADFDVGTKHQYNNSGYVLLGAVIERVTGKPWHVAVDERIAKPLGLETIRYGEFEAATPLMAVGYSDKGGEIIRARPLHMSVPHAAGALIGSVEDLAKWSEALHKGTVLPAARYQQMIAPTTLPDGKVEKYGYGLAQDTLRGREAIRHGGGIFGFSTAATYLPEEDVFVAVFANSDEPEVGPGVTLAKLAAMAVGDPFPDFETVDVPQAEIDPLLGLYEYEGGNRRFYSKDGKLFTRLKGSSELEVFPAGNDRFFYGPQNLSWFEVKRDPSGKHVMLMHSGGADKALESVRSGPVPPEAPVVDLPRSVLETYAGDYNAKLGVATVGLTDGGPLTIRLGKGDARPLLATSETEFRIDGSDVKVVFYRNAGTVTHLIVHQGDTEIRAERQPVSG